MSFSWRRLAVAAALPVTIVVVWWLVSARSLHPFYPPLSEIFDRFATLWFGGRFVTDALPSLRNAAIGFAIASIVGALGAYAMTLWAPVGRMFGPVVYFIQAVPNTALLPAALIVLGIGANMHVAMIVLAAFPSILLNSLTGFRSIEPQLVDTMAIYPAHPIRRLLQVELPSAAPHVFAGMRTGLRRAVLMMVAAEMFGAESGIGYFTLQASRTFRTVDMWAGILLLGVIGYVANVIFQLVENRVLRWYLAPRAQQRQGA